MLKYLRVNSANSDFQNLVRELDSYLAIINGADNSFFTQFNKIEDLQYVIVACDNNTAVGCGAIKEYSDDSVEVKRMFVRPEMRGRGIASQILRELENWAKELNYSRCILETSETMNDAVQLYKKSNYAVIPNYGQYKDVKTSVCFEKILG